MKNFPIQKRTLGLLAAIVPLLALFIYVAMRSGPLAPVSVQLATVERKSISPALYGIGTIDVRYAYEVGPTVAGRVKDLKVQVGDTVRAGQKLGEMDPIDLNDRIMAQDARLKQALAHLEEARARQEYARGQFHRYQRLLESQSTSEENVAAKRQEMVIAEASLAAVNEELARLRSEREALLAQRGNLGLFAPVDSLVVARNSEPGTTVVPGQAVVELIDPQSVWVNVRFDQIHAGGLATGLPARITLRSQPDQAQSGRVFRVEPLADTVTEEVLAKVIFDQTPEPLPPVGELAEVVVQLPELSPGLVIPNAAVHQIEGQKGVWRVVDGELLFVPVTLEAFDLAGQVLVRGGVQDGDRVVVYSERALHPRSRIRPVERLTE